MMVFGCSRASKLPLMGIRGGEGIQWNIQGSSCSLGLLEYQSLVEKQKRNRLGGRESSVLGR